MDVEYIVFVVLMVIGFGLVYWVWLYPENVSKAKASASVIAQKEWAVYDSEIDNGVLNLVLNADISGQERLFAEISNKHRDFYRLSALDRFDRIRFEYSEEASDLSAFDPWAYLRLKP